ncbi:CPBP family intramembrane glutamic endopeptidase [Trichocoleus sp. FACHB-46]|uniref:CPBP family intramembrane metalloprotease n=2 Tax=Trichocoleus TaxID=450526 RepID=A0ABV0JA74_9CYAN|nr:CPBP family intramembrane glutamic endopeptidase [Trichocoleus sp. FACHB-46]MBD1861172.1 CPBP family intramembrane metalloprotease [Trichocoleus sp. FACHB-46]
MLDQATHLMISSFIEASAIIKAVVFFIVWVVVWLPLGIPLAIALKWQPPQPITPSQKLPLLAPLYLIAPLILWGFARIQGVPFSGYGLTRTAAFFGSSGLGLILGILGLAVLFGFQVALGWIQWPLSSQISRQNSVSEAGKTSSWSWRIWLPTLVLGLWVSVTEELIFRGFLLNQLQQDYSLWLAGAIASGIFAVLHLVWEGPENIPQLPGLWLMGMVLVLARQVDGGSLGLACGLHAGWIWGIASLDAAQAIAYTGKGPTWMTGLGQQPLAGVMGLLFLVGTGVGLWWLGAGGFIANRY